MGIGDRVAGMNQDGLASGDAEDVPDVFELGGGVLLPAMPDAVIDPRWDAGNAIRIGLPRELQRIANQFPVLIQGPMGPRRCFPTALKDEQWRPPLCEIGQLAGRSRTRALLHP